MTSATPETTTSLASSDKSNSKSSMLTKDPASEEASKHTENEAVKKYVPPKVWSIDAEATAKQQSKFSNRPTAGARFEQKLPVGEHNLQLYSLGTPNGQKVTILLEELLAAGYTQVDYDAWTISIMKGDQFGSDFVDLNPNSKIPTLFDKQKAAASPDDPDAGKVFESGSILLYLSELCDNAFVPSNIKTKVLNWLFWQVGSAPFLGGGFGHFYTYAPEKLEYPINRYAMETKRQLDVLNRQLASGQPFICGDDYTLADMAIFPWYGQLALGKVYAGAKEFLNVDAEYPHVVAWAQRIAARPAVQRGLIVNKPWGDKPQLDNRHSAADIDQAFAEAAAEEQSASKL